MQRKNIVITGASGFVGKNLIPLLVRKKYDVSVVGRNAKHGFGGAVPFHAVDLTREFPSEAACIADVIIHLASEIDINRSVDAPRERLERNLAMTLSILEAVRQSGRKPLIIFASTDRVYGKTKKRIVTEAEPPFPIEPYTASKILCETALATYAHLYDIPYIALRFDSIYGPHQPREMFISDVIQKMLAGGQIATGALSVRKNFVYVGDVTDAIMAAIRAPAPARNQVYNIGGSPASLRDLVRLLGNIMESRSGRKVSVTEGVSAKRSSQTEVAPFALSTAKARRLLRWQARTDLKRGLRQTVEHFAERTNSA